MSEINLLHSDPSVGGRSSSFAAKFIARIILLLVVGVILLYAALYFYTWRNTSKIESVNQQVQTMQTEAMADTERNEVVTRQAQLIELETLIDNHLYWSYLLPELARVTLKSAKYTDIEAKSNGQLNLSVSLPNYGEVEKYMQIFDLPEYNQQFSNVRIIGIDTVQKETAIETLLRLQLTFNSEYIKGRM